MDLGIDPDDLASCVACGLCLPHCPTYRITGEEAVSPRGRIAMMKGVQAEGLTVDSVFRVSMDTCVQCRGCEAACPSGVPFGRMIEATRSALAPTTVPWWQRLGYSMLARHRLILVGSSVLSVVQRVRLVPRRFGLPSIPVRRQRLLATGSDVWFFPGCVMDAWQRPVHVDSLFVLARMGVGVALPDSSPCCGALSVHAGLTDQARRFARQVMAGYPGTNPILVNSAGCGAALKDYGHLLDTDEARLFSARVLDIHEWIAEHLDDLPVGRQLPFTVAVQDPCHLRHVQKAHLPVRTVLGRYMQLVELDDDGLCCGAGGAFSTLYPDIASTIRERKLGAIERAGKVVVASANPGCSIHLSAAGVIVRHPLELVAEALRS